jgi:hypothetical protein
VSASEKLKALDEAMSDSTIGFIMGVDDGSVSEWPPNIALLIRLRDALPQIVAVVEAAQDVQDEWLKNPDPRVLLPRLFATLAALDEALP